MLLNNFRYTAQQKSKSKTLYILIKNLIFYFILLISIQSVHARNSYRIDHHLNVLGETEWVYVPTKIKESKWKSITSNMNYIYNKTIANPYRKFMSTYHAYDSEEAVEGGEEKVKTDIPPCLKGDEAFQITFNCEIKNTGTCRKAEKAFREAAYSISEVINIYTGPILINATLTSFCELAHPDGSACNADDPTRRKLGQAYPYASHPAIAVNPADGDTDIYLYPQALFKQLNIVSKGIPDYAEYDITAEFNSDVNWYFDQNDDRIDDEQHDFVYVAIHELIHGLGFISSWRDLFEDMQLKYLAPRLITATKGNENVIMGWQHMQIFDKYIQIHKSGAYLKERGKAIMKYGNDNEIVSQLDWIEGFHKSQSGQIAQEVYDIATSGKRVFSVTSIDNDFTTYLHTFKGKFVAGTCIGHLDDDEYTNKPDFLLRPFVRKGEDIDDLIEKGSFSYMSEEEKSKKDLWGKTAFGPHLISILEMIGWSTKYHPERREVEYVDAGLSRYVKNTYLNFFIILSISLSMILF